MVGAPLQGSRMNEEFWGRGIDTQGVARGLPLGRLVGAESYRSFTVASAIAASMAVMSQNLVTTCVSVHPLRWKW